MKEVFLRLCLATQDDLQLANSLAGEKTKRKSLPQKRSEEKNRKRMRRKTKTSIDAKIFIEPD